ncbi:MAG TPA: LEA type 2 family protein [Candidatus Nanoarchaeia archaeon]|nr:LEA type 2 family protein [Candidatus Nanoarchaeia archaeon]
MKALGFTISLIVLVILSIAGYIGYQAFNTGIEEAKVTSITPNSEGFTIAGTLAVHNPSWVPIPVRSGAYKIYLEGSNELIGEGTIDGKTLTAGETTILSFQQEMKWTPSGSLLLQLALKEHVYANFKGTITLDFFGIQQLDLPFEQRIDLAEYVQALKKNIIDNVKSLAQAFLG